MKQTLKKYLDITWTHMTFYDLQTMDENVTLIDFLPSICCFQVFIFHSNRKIIERKWFMQNCWWLIMTFVIISYAKLVVSCTTLLLQFPTFLVLYIIDISFILLTDYVPLLTKRLKRSFLLYNFIFEELSICEDYQG